MQINHWKIGPIVCSVFLILAGFAFPPRSFGAEPIVSTDKKVYNPGEAIKVTFSEAPGIDGDWICIAPAGFPDTATDGEVKYLPKGWSKGFLTFDSPPAPGKYEARAYYDYQRNGYVVSGRAAFSVEGGPGWEAAVLRMERKLDPKNSMEAGLPPGNGLVYLFRESLFISSGADVQIMANGKPVIFMQNASYFPFSVPAGVLTFTPGEIRDHFSSSGNVTQSIRQSEANIKVEPGYAYYVRVRIVPMPLWAVTLEQMPHRDGAAIIESYKLTLLKK